jgi:hypothetical protein
MPVARRTTRTSQNIQTLSGRADQKRLPHKTFLRIACLEMERERRGQERRSALHRLRSIEDRFREIDEEKQRLLDEIGGAPAGNPPARLGPPAATGAVPLPRGEFKVRY